MVAGPIISFLLDLTPVPRAGPITGFALDAVVPRAGPTISFVLDVGARRAGPICAHILSLGQGSGGPIMGHLLDLGLRRAGPIASFKHVYIVQYFAGPVCGLTLFHYPLITPLNPNDFPVPQYKTVGPAREDCVGNGGEDSPGICGREGTPL